ncbi:WW domain-binding protein 4 [Termitomyces sp. T112]|nr:hypothetical protein C0989_010203 [Termitomyces sp. Mn162]KAG5733240.1 WW domain-binding protein 4 [Termitomyces sp. T112]KNZ75044.1 WW domain-binding protein 4 [Termitomyces sp. J132]
MSEYWVSKKKYLCKYCDIYIADDAPSRQQHENGLRHKGNLDRFIRGLYKAGEKRRKDENEEKRELARLEQAAQVAYAQDVAAGRARPATGPVASTSAASKKPVPKPSNPYTNYSTAASLGYTDPDVQRMAGEAERRRTQGIVGEWEVVDTITPTLEAFSNNDEKPDAVEDVTAAGVKREAEAPADEDAPSFKLRKKGWLSGLSGGYDPDSIPIKLKKKEEAHEVSVPTFALIEVTSTAVTPETTTTSTGAPRWAKVQWKASEAATEVETSTARLGSEAVIIKSDIPVSTSALMEDEVNSPAVPLPPTEEAKALPRKSEVPFSAPEPSAFGMFRKRKIPTGGNRGRRP